MSHFNHLTDRELLLAADNARDPLTTTALEITLTERFAALVAKAEAAASVQKLLEEHYLNPLRAEDIDLIEAALELAARPYVNELLDVLMDNDIDTPAALQSVFENLRQLETQE